jgi:hypothetical protein
MSEQTQATAPAGWEDGTLSAARRLVATRPRQVLLAVTLVLGASVAVAMPLAAPPVDRTFAGVCGLVQILMSVPLPFFGGLLSSDLAGGEHQLRRAPVALAAGGLATAVALVGAAMSALALTLAGPGAGAVWAHAGMVVLGSVVVQLVAQFVGTGLGLLIRRRALAMAATIVVPLGLLLVLGVAPLRPIQPWLVPYPSAQQLLTGAMGPVSWARLLVVVVLWDVGLNLLGLRLMARRPVSAVGVDRPPASARR